ncbi:MAG: YeiH family protein [Bacteroidota bacterium]|nr:YeiH family protein [Bacteroidota bacterium]
MKFYPELNRQSLPGLFLVTILALVATWLAGFPVFFNIGISPLILGILLGMLVGNTIRSKFPPAWTPGIIFSAKKILRLAIILYGFRITFQQISEVGMAGLTADILMLSSTFLIGSFVGIRLLRIDADMTFLVASGASVCGAAAVLATEPVLRSEPYKTAIAVATVVLFGTTAMFLYPVLYRAGLMPMDENSFGIYIGASVHEVAHVVAAGNAISAETADTAVIVKMTRVMLLVPLLIALGLYVSSRKKNKLENTRIYIPWFAVGFILVAAFNSFNFIPKNIVQSINTFDTFLLTMAMTALGMETNLNKFRTTGGKPVLLAFILFLWLILGGFLTTLLVAYL